MILFMNGYFLNFFSSMLSSNSKPFTFMLYLGGSLLLFDRNMLRNFRKDGHRWRKKKDGKTVQEAHEKLKV